MNKKVTKNDVIRLVLAILSFAVSIFMYNNTNINNVYDDYYLVPLFYGFCLLLSFKLDFLSFKSPGSMVLNYTMIVKYLLMPLIMCIGNYYSWLGTFPTDAGINKAIILTIIEMVSLMIVMNIMNSKENKYKENEGEVIPLKRTVIHYLVIILGISIVFLIPETIKDHRFIFNTDNLAVNIKVDFQFSGIYKTLFIFARYSLVLLIINYFYKRNQKKKSKLNIIYAFIPVFANCLYISNLSRISIFVPLLTFSIVIFMLFKDKEERKMIIRFLLIMMISSITFMSALKFFGKGRGNEDRVNDVGWWGDTLNMYFSGPKETAIGIDAEDLINNVYGSKRYKLILNDVFSNVIGLSHFTNKKINSTVLYNYEYFSSSIAICQIAPNIIEGYYYFGIIFCWVWPCFFAYLCFLFNKKAQNSHTLDLKFPYLYASIYCGMVLMINSSMIICNIINVSLLFILMAGINKKVSV